jgi:pimeloyl-ACP methyl ester carboxylesterase
MHVDRDLLERHASFVVDDVDERAFTFDVGSDRCFALLYRPATVSSLGFVVCHSYGLEFLTLRRMERAIARTLASLGHPVLAFHSRGYGDSTGSLADATLNRHLEDVRAAARRLAAESGATEFGLIGVRFGALMAGLLARDDLVKRLIMVDPEFSGARYFRGLIRDKHVVELVNSDGGPRLSMGELLRVLHQGGTLDLLGYELHGHLYDALADVDLTKDVGRFSGEALVVQVTKRPTPSRPVEAFAKQVEGNGGRCRLEIVKEPRGVTIGGPAFVNKTDRNVREDLQEPVVEEISNLLEEWIRP